MSRDVEITIFNRKYVLRSEANEDRLREVARYVDSKMTEVSRSMTAAPTSIAVLGALNIANELFDYRDRIEEKLAEMERRSAELLEMIDAQLEADEPPDEP